MVIIALLIDTGKTVYVDSSRPDFLRVRVCYFNVTNVIITQKALHKAI